MNMNMSYAYDLCWMVATISVISSTKELSIYTWKQPKPSKEKNEDIEGVRDSENMKESIEYSPGGQNYSGRCTIENELERWEVRARSKSLNLRL